MKRAAIPVKRRDAEYYHDLWLKEAHKCERYERLLRELAALLRELGEIQE